MAKVHPNQVRRVVRAPETVALTDDDHPGVIVTLTLRRIDPLELEKTTETAAELARRHIYGNFWDPVRECIIKDPEPYVCDDGEVLLLTDSALQLGAKIEAMQCGPAEDRYSLLEILELSAKMPGIFSPMVRFMEKIQYPKAMTETNLSETSSSNPPST